MKSATSTILAIIVASCFSLTAYVMGQGRSPGGSGMSNPGQSMQGQNTRDLSNSRTTSMSSAAPTASASASAKVKTSPSPRGHHYGWQKGKHNPHRMTSPSASPSASASMTPSSMSSPTATAGGTSSPYITAPPTQPPGR